MALLGDSGNYYDEGTGRYQKNYQQGNPYWNQAGIEADSKSALYNDFYKLFGRAPTDVETAKFFPAYRGADSHITDTAQGNSVLANYYDQQNPNGSAEKNAAGQYDTVNGLFQKTLQRDATDAEKQHFGTLLASKQYDPYTIGQFLQTLPENVQKQDKAFREGLSGDLQKQDAQYYNEQVMPGIAQNFAKQGRSFDSTAYAQALAQAAQGQNRQREGFLSNLSASQYQNSSANARSDYMNNYAYTRDRSNQLADQNTQRLYDIQNFNMQKGAYDQYLQRYGKRSNNQGIGQLAGGALGAGLGGYFGGLKGAEFGYGAGSGIGGGTGSFFG